MRELAIDEKGDDMVGSSAVTLFNNKRSLLTSCVAPSILDLILQKHKSRSTFISMEFIPGTTKVLKELLNESLHAVIKTPPLFASVTWQPKALVVTKHSPGDIAHVHHPAIDLANILQNQCDIPVLLHLSASMLNVDKMRTVLSRAQSLGIRNILALRGDVGDLDRVDTDFHHAVDVVSFIRKEYGNYFTIGVGGYPAGHPEAVSSVADLHYLKDKVDAGADFILTQVVFSAQQFNSFVRDCRHVGVTVPIIPGILLMQSYNSLQQMAAVCKVEVPQHLDKEFSSLSGNAAAELKYGIQQTKCLMEELQRGCYCPGIHIFTLNRALPSLEVCNSIGLI